jgi:hypothetical protein
MRRLLFVALLFLGVGCQGLPARRGCEEAAECKPAKPEAKKPAETVAAPTPRQDSAAIAQDVLLVPKMVYIPYVAQTPTAPMRMTMGLPAPPVENLPAPKTPAATPAPPEEKTKRELEQKCQELCDRVLQLEKRLRECSASPPAPPACPPSTPLLDFFRRPVIQRCDPLQPCEPICDTPAPAESIQAPKKMPQRD